MFPNRGRCANFGFVMLSTGQHTRFSSDDFSLGQRKDSDKKLVMSLGLGSGKLLNNTFICLHLFSGTQ